MSRRAALTPADREACSASEKRENLAREQRDSSPSQNILTLSETISFGADRFVRLRLAYDISELQRPTNVSYRYTEDNLWLNSAPYDSVSTET